MKRESFSNLRMGSGSEIIQKMSRLAVAVLIGSAFTVSCNANKLNDNIGDMGDPFMGPFKDLPAGPIGAGGVTSDAASSLFSAFGQHAGSATGFPCMTEPTMGALYPLNFTPPLFEWTSDTGQNIFELRLHLDNQVNDLVVYTDEKSFTLSDEMWQGLTSHSSDRDIQISIRGGQLVNGQLMNGVSNGSMGSVRIAPVSALGSIVYWWIIPANNSTGLKGFRIGDKSVRDVLSPASITQAGMDTKCVGCHTSSPDGALAFFGRTEPWFSIDARQVNGSSGAPTGLQVTTNALTNLARTNQDFPVMSKAHYTPQDAVVVTVMNNGTNGRWELNWTDLHATTGGTGILSRIGDLNGAATPTWSHDGSTIIYASSDNSKIIDGRLSDGNSDLLIVPYANRAGGTAQPLPGVNDTIWNQYYPTYSPGDTFVSFNRVKRGNQMYDAQEAEIWVAPAKGGTPTRLAANDPPACSGKTSPGITNSWARWSPSSTLANGKHYYWVVFSSRRSKLGNPQIYLTALVTKDSPAGEVLESTYPAIYIPTQPADENNHTPAWDEFLIPAG